MSNPTRTSRFETTLYKVLPIGTFAVAALMLAFYLGFTYKAMFHSDSAMKLLLAEEMARQFTLLPRHWNYVNDIPIIFPSLIAAPLSFVFPPSFPLHAFVDMVAAALVLYAAYVASRALGIDGPLRWLVPTLLASALSDAFAEAVFGQSAYSAVIFVLLLLSGWGARYVSGVPHNAHRNRGLLGIAVLVLIGVASGHRGLATYVAPLCAAAAASCFFGAHDIERNRGLRLLGVTLSAAFAGGLIFILLLHIVDFHDGTASQHFVGGSLIPAHIALVVTDWFNLFASFPRPGTWFGPLAAALSVVRLMLALVLAVLPLALLLRIATLTSARLRFLVAMHACLLVITLYMLVFTQLFVDPARGEPRYLVSLIPTSLLIFALWLQELFVKRPQGAVQASLAFSLAVLASAPAILVKPAFVNWPEPGKGLRENPRSAVVEALRREGLHRGYATYWNASLMTVLSGGDVRVAPVLLGDGSLMAPFHHLTAERWYAPEWSNGPTFLILDGSDAKALNRTALAAVAGEPERTLHVAGYEVLVYPFNVGQRMGFNALPYITISPDTDFCSGEYAALNDHLQLQPRAFGALPVKITNRSQATWSQNSRPPFNPGLRILDSTGKQVSEFRALLAATVPPGESTTVIVPFRAPPAAGTYTVQASVVLEAYAWCGNRTGKWAQASLSVTP